MAYKALLLVIVVCCGITSADDHSADHLWEQAHIEKNQESITRLQVDMAALKGHDHVELQNELKELRAVHQQILGALSFINKAIVAFGVVLVPLIAVIVAQHVSTRRNNNNHKTGG